MGTAVVGLAASSAAAIAFGSSVGLWVIPIGILVNVALLLAGLTRTLNVDVWNFWHFAFVGSLVVAATGSGWIAFWTDHEWRT